MPAAPGDQPPPPPTPPSPDPYPSAGAQPPLPVWHRPGWQAPRLQQGGRLPPQALWIIGIVAVLAVVGLVAFLVTRDHGSAGTASISGTPGTSERSNVETTEGSDIESSDISTTSTPVSTPRDGPTVTIGGTCDDGKSCGVKQRTEPRLDAPDLVPQRLKDGMTVTVVCFTTGDTVSNRGRGSSDVWYQIGNGAYVPVVYMNLEGTDDPAPC